MTAATTTITTLPDGTERLQRTETLEDGTVRTSTAYMAIEDPDECCGWMGSDDRDDLDQHITLHSVLTELATDDIDRDWAWRQQREAIALVEHSIADTDRQIRELLEDGEDPSDEEFTARRWRDCLDGLQRELADPASIPS